LSVFVSLSLAFFASLRETSPRMHARRVLVSLRGGTPMRRGLFCFLAALLTVVVPSLAPFAADAHKTKKIVLIGMNRDHGRGEHEYMAGLAILAECLKQTPGLEVTVVKVGAELPEDTKFLDDAHTVVCFLKRAGELFFKKKENRAKFEALMKKGTGFVCLHWAVEGPKELGDPFMAVLGGYYEPGFSTNPHNTTTVKPAGADHPIARGWKPFETRDEFYFKIRLLPDAKPAIVASALTDK